MKISEKAFTQIVANIVLTVVIVAVVTVSLAGNITSAFNADNGYKPYYNGNRDSKNVSLMVNVYWGNEFIPEMLQIFKEKGVAVTFFIGGMWAERYPDLLLDIKNAGHELGNHGYFHKDQDKLDFKGNYDEINVAGNMIESVTGIKPVLFAPPSGAFNSDTLRAAETLGYSTIMWSKDTIDWRDKDADLIYKRATKNPHGGDLILMHPTQMTVKALEKIIDFYQQNGFNLVTVSKNLG